MPKPTSFNPRAREGRDTYRVDRKDRQRVSIHAPVKGATTWRSSSVTLRCFNPRAREGRDLIAVLLNPIHVFQSTRP